MVDMLTPVLSDAWDTERPWTLESYEGVRGYEALDTAFGMAQDDLIALVKDSGLRGRGGAGFPTGMKWGFIPQGDGKPHYLVVNADESEPGTCKDIPLMMASPHTLVEGVILTCYAIRANHAFIYVRGEVLQVVRRLQRAVAGGLPRRPPRQGHPRLRLRPRRHRARGRRGVHLRRGDRAARLAGGPSRPAPAAPAVPRRRRPVRRADGDQQRRVDLSVPSIVRNGPEWFASMGTEKSKGMTLYSLSGHVKRPASSRRRSGSRCASCSTSPAASATATS